MYKYVSKCIHMYTYIYICIHMYTYVYICIHIYTYKSIHIHIYIHINTNIYTNIYIYTYTYIHTYIYVYCGLQNTINQHYFYSFVQSTLLFSIHFCQIKRMSNSVREKMVKGQCRTDKLIGISHLQI